MILWKEQTTKQNSEANIKGQIASAQEAEKSKQETESVKGEFTLQKVKMEFVQQLVDFVKPKPVSCNNDLETHLETMYF